MSMVSLRHRRQLLRLAQAGLCLGSLWQPQTIVRAGAGIYYAPVDVLIPSYGSLLDGSGRYINEVLQILSPPIQESPNSGDWVWQPASCHLVISLQRTSLRLVSPPTHRALPLDTAWPPTTKTLIASRPAPASPSSLARITLWNWDTTCTTRSISRCRWKLHTSEFRQEDAQRPCWPSSPHAQIKPVGHSMRLRAASSSTPRMLPTAARFTRPHGVAHKTVYSWSPVPGQLHLEQNDRRHH